MRLVPALACIVAGLACAAAAPPRLAPEPGATLAAAEPGDTADDADFLFRLGMLEGHLMIGRELLDAHQQALALPHFGHPVREIYDDIADYLTAHKFPPFDKQLAALEAQVAAHPDSPETRAKYDAMIATVHRARDLAPAEMRASIPAMIKLCSNVVDAASGEFGESIEQGRIAAIVEYHDSRGYLAYAAQQVAALAPAQGDTSGKTLITRFDAVLAKAQWIVSDLLPGPDPRASVSDYRAIAAEAVGLTAPATASPAPR
jgi:hypothetical protein